MYDNKNQSDGAIYTNNFKKTEKQPDWTGKVELSRDMLKELVTIIKNGGTGELRVALWKRSQLLILIKKKKLLAKMIFHFREEICRIHNITNVISTLMART